MAILLVLSACGAKRQPATQSTVEATAGFPGSSETQTVTTGQDGIPAASSTIDQPALTPTLPTGTAGAVWQAISIAQQALLNVPDFQSQTAISNLNTKETITSTLEYQSPDRFRLLTRDHDTVVVSSTTYTNDRQTGWKISPVALQGIAALQKDAILLQAQAADILNGKILGSESFNGTPTQVYQYSITREGVTSTIKLWIGVSDHLPRKVEIESEAAAIKTLTTILYTYQNIEIQAPSVQK